MREAEVIAGLTEAQLYERARDEVLDELRGIGSDLIRFLGGKSRLRTVLGVEMTLDGQDTLTVDFFQKGRTPFSGKRVKMFKNVSLDRLVSVLKKHSKVVQ